MQKLLNKFDQLFIFWIFFISSVLVTILSKCSPLYVFNDYVDSIALVTLVKNLGEDKLLYKDIYDHKGPLWSMVYSFSYNLSNEYPLIGIYLLEILCLAIFLIFTNKCIKLFINDQLALVLVNILLPFFIICGKHFTSGGAIEEFCLPLLMIGYYLLLRKIHNNELLGNKDIFIIGIFCSIIFWLKYTILGFYLGFALYIIYFYIKKKKVKELLKTIGYFLLGFIIVSIPILISFYLKGNLPDLWNVYFYDNIFNYGNTEPGVQASKIYYLYYNTLAAIILYNPFCICLSVLGLCFIFKKNKNAFCLSLFGFCFAFLAVIFGYNIYAYYTYPLSLYVGFGLLFILSKLNLKLQINKINLIAIASLPFFMMIWVMGQPAVKHIQLEKSDYAQYQFAEIINKKEDATILNCGFTDGGFYLASGINPINKYYYFSNTRPKEMVEELIDILENEKVNYLITRNETLEEVIEFKICKNIDVSNYNLIQETESYSNNDICIYRLYELQK